MIARQGQGREQDLQHLVDEIIGQLQTRQDSYKKYTEDIETLYQYITKRNYLQAIWSALQVIVNSFALKAKGGFRYCRRYIKTLSLEEKSPSALLFLIKTFSQQLEKSDFSLSKKTDITYLMSCCKDEFFRRSDKIATSYDTLLYNFYHTFTSQGAEKRNPIGTILLLNRGKVKSNSIASFIRNHLLRPREQAVSGTMFQHSVVISGIQTDGTFLIIGSDGTKGGVIEESLENYISTRPKNLDIMAVEVPNYRGLAVVDFIRSKLGAEYDNEGMLHDTLVGKRDEQNFKEAILKNHKDKFYCSELIFSGLEASGYKVDKKLFSPGDLLNICIPHYCTTINRSQLIRKVENNIITS